MKLCILTITFIFPCLCTFWHAIPTSPFIFNDFSFLFNLSRAYALPPSVLAIFNTHEVNYQGFWKNGSFIERVLRNQQHFVDTNPGGIENNLHHRDDSSCSQFERKKPWQWLANEAIVIFVDVFTNSLNNRAKPKTWLKAQLEDAQYRVFT